MFQTQVRVNDLFDLLSKESEEALGGAIENVLRSEKGSLFVEHHPVVRHKERRNAESAT